MSSRNRHNFIAATASLALVVVTAVGVRAEEAATSLNAIIRALAPIEYLPEHGGKRRAIDLDIPFELSSNRLTSRAKRQLDVVAEALRGRELLDQRFQIVGHTDASGSTGYNLALSQRRAEAVRLYLAETHGISAGRLMSVGKGEGELKNSLSPEGAENRRVEFVLVQPAQDRKPLKRKTGEQKVIKW